MAFIVGVQFQEGTNQKGMPYKGYAFYATEELKKGEGVRTLPRVYVSYRNAEPFVSHFENLKDMLGVEVEFFYNNYNPPQCVDIRLMK